MTNNTITIKEHLKNYGYNLDYSYNASLCAQSLKKHLGNKKYNEFWNYVDQMYATFGDDQIEKIIRSYVGNDMQHLKIQMSGQIGISVEVLKKIIESINALHYLENEIDILELGGFDGWSSDYLNKSINVSSNIDVVDIEGGFDKKNPNIQLIQSNYSDFISTKKYNIVFSILGIPYKNVGVLIDCIKRNIYSKGTLYIALRLQPEEYEKFKSNMIENGFTSPNEPLKIIKVNLDSGTEHLPLFKFTYV